MAQGWVNVGAWQTGWTTDTAHLVVGKAGVHGNANHTLVKGKCGTNFNPGVIIDPVTKLSQHSTSRTFTLCSACLSGPTGKSVARQAKPERTRCADADCDYGFASKTSPYCSTCRPYHSHSYKATAEGFCFNCGEAQSAAVHQ